MNRYPLIWVIISALCMLVLPGCFRVSLLVHINPDGSGTLEQHTLISKKAFMQMLAFYPNQEDTSTLKKIEAGIMKGFMQAQSNDSIAKTFGKGVVLKHVSIEENTYGKGSYVVYGFNDINEVKLSGAGSANSKFLGFNTNPRFPKKYSFHYNPKTRALEILTPDYLSQPVDFSIVGTLMEQFYSLMSHKGRDAFGGGEILFAVEGDSLSSNATYTQDKRIVLMQLNGDLYASQDTSVFHKLHRATIARNYTELKDIYSHLKGLKLETKPIVTAHLN